MLPCHLWKEETNINPVNVDVSPCPCTPSLFPFPLTRISSLPRAPLQEYVCRSPSHTATLCPGCGLWIPAPTAAGSQSTPACVACVRVCIQMQRVL